MKPEQHFIAAFNHGYIMAQFEPDFINTLCNHLHKHNEYMEGLFAGKEQYTLDQQREHSSQLQHLRTIRECGERGREQ